MRTRLVFITGTDTGVGKTLLTALLLCHLRSQGVQALALKPFCSGGRADAELLHRLQNDDLSLDDINPFYFPEPVAPLISARQHHRETPLRQAVNHVRWIVSRMRQVPIRNFSSSIKNSKLGKKSFLLVEGAGGLLVPLGEGYTVRELIAELGGDVLVVSRNQLGTINHSLLTLHTLGARTAFSAGALPRRPARVGRSVKLVLMEQRLPDVSSRTNAAILRELAYPVPLAHLPFLGSNCRSSAALRRAAGELRSLLSRLISL